MMTGIDVARSLWELPAPARRRAILGELVDCFGPQAAEPIGYDEVYWQAETFSRGCVSYCGPGVWTGYGPGLRAPVGRIHWAGAEVATAYPGNMEGAVRSGEDAAAAALGRLD